MTDEPHAGLEVRCPGPDVDDDETHEDCGTELVYEEHGRYVPSSPSSVREQYGFEQAALRFDCPDCGRTLWKCPMCSDSEDNSPPGWFIGESTGEQLACANCNVEEMMRQRREEGL